MIRVLVVDDSAFMRKAIAMMLEEEPEITVVGTARDGLDAVNQVKRLKPDLVTMDVEMPRMDGIEAVRQIMATQPTPILMISSITKKGAQATIDALQAGAVDFISKELSFVSLEITNIRGELIAKAKAIAGARSRFARLRTFTHKHIASKSIASAPSVGFERAQAIVIGVSTGGPSALRAVVPHLPANFPLPVFIVQHMPPHFTTSLATRLDSLSSIRVVEAKGGEVAKAGHVYIAPGGKQLILQKRGADVILTTPDEPHTLHRPSVDVMFGSAVNQYGGNLLGVIMTGMGNDGLEGARRIKQSGGRLLAQDEQTSVVYGMPRAVTRANLVDTVLPLDHLAGTIIKTIQQPSNPRRRLLRRTRSAV